jgi:hypothetical protein
VGVGGGGLLVLIVVLVWLFTGSDSSTQQRQPLASEPTQPIEEVSPTAPDETPQPDQPWSPDELASQRSADNEPPPKEPKPRPSEQPDDGETLLAQADSDGPSKPGKNRPQGSRQPKRPREEPAAQSQPTTAVRDDDTAAAEAAAADQQPERRPEGPGVPAKGDAGRAEGITVPPEPVQAEPQPPKPQLSPNQIFARLKAFALDVSMELDGGGGPNKKPQQNVQAQTAALRPGIEAAVEYAVRTSGLELVSDSGTAVMHVTIYPGEAQNFKTLDIAASLDCRDQGSEPVSVWKLGRTEVMRFTSAANPRVLRETWEDNLRDIFRALRDAHEAVSNGTN